MDKTSSAVKIGEAAKILGVSVKTLRRWEKAGKISSTRTPGGTRLYSLENLKSFNTSSGSVSITEAAREIGVSTRTLRRWNESGKLKAQKNPSGKIIYSTQDLQQAFQTGTKYITPVQATIRKSLVKIIHLKFFSGAAFALATIFVLATILLTGSYVISPKATSRFSANRPYPLLSSLNKLSLEIAENISPGIKAIVAEEFPPPVENQKYVSSNSNVLAVTASSPFLEVNSNTQILGSLFVRDLINNLSLEATPSAGTMAFVSGDTTLTVTNNALLDQDVSTTSTPSFDTLNLTATSNQITFGTGGILTWTPAAARTITLPDVTTTLVGIDNTQTLTNKSMSGSSNTFTNIPNSALSNNKVTVSAGTNLSGGGDVSLGASVSLALKDSPAISGVLSLADGTAAAPSLTFSNDLNTGLYRIGTDKIGLITGGSATKGITIDASGNIGVGTISPTFQLETTGNAGIGASLTVTSAGIFGSIETQELSASGNTTLNTLTASGNTGIGGSASIASLLSANGSAAISGSLCLNGECKPAWTGSGNYTASNGITLSGVDFQLGGQLSRATGIDINNQSFGFLRGNVGIGTTSPDYTFRVNGTGLFTGFVGIGSSLNVAGNVGIGASINTTSAGIFGSLGASSLSISGNSTLGTLTTTGNVGVGASINVTSAGIFGSLGSSTLSVSGNSTLSTLTVSGNTGIGSSLNVSSAGIFGSLGTSALSVSGNSTLGTLTTVGNVGVGASINVTSAGIFGSLGTSALSVSGNTTLNTLTTSGNAGIGQSLTVTSATTLDSLSVTKSISAATLGTTGNVGIGGSASITGLTYALGGLRVNGYSDLTGNVGIGSSLNVTSVGLFDGLGTSSLSVSGNTTLGTLYTTGNVGLGSSASVVSILTAGSVDTSTLSVSGNTTLNTLTTAGNAGIGQSLTVSSAAILDSLSVTKSISGATLGISGDSNLATVYTSGNVGIGATTSSNKLDVWGNQRISGTLTVDSTGTLGSGLIGYSGVTAPTSGLAVSGNIGIGTTSTLAPLHIWGNNTTSALFLNGNVGIGFTTANSKLDVTGNVTIAPTSAGADGLKLTNGTSKVLGLRYGPSDVTMDIFSPEPTNLLSNSSFESDLTNWDDPETTVTLQPDDTSGLDTFIWQPNPDLNRGTQTQIVVGEGSASTDNVMRTLIKFDLSSIPSSATVASATLSLYQYDDAAAGDSTVSAYRLLRSWVEGQATWNIYSTGNSWETAGGFGANDAEQSAIGTTIIPKDYLTKWVSWTLTASEVQEWISGELTNNGMLLKSTAELNDAFYLYSSDYTTASQRPKLVITYATPPTVTRDTATTYGGSAASAKIVTGAASGQYVQSVNAGDTNSYNLVAYAYTDGSAVTSADASLYYNGSTITTTYTPVGGGWYRLAGSLTGANEARNYGVQVEANKTVYVDNLSLQSGVGATKTLYMANTGTGISRFSLEGQTTINTKVASEKGLVIQGVSSQTGNLTEWQNSSGLILSAIDANGNLGIGTSVPRAKLSIQGNVGIGYTGVNQAIPVNGLAVLGNVGIGITTANSSLSIAGSAHIGSLRQGFAAPADGLFVDGNVGIGATTSSNKLDVWGNTRIAGTGTFDSTLTALNGLFGYSGVTAPTSGLAISGNLGVGTTSPNNKLQVIGGGVFGNDYAQYSAPSSGLLVQGNVGIGSTGSVNYNLDVWGTGRITEALTVGGNIGVGASINTTSAGIFGSLGTSSLSVSGNTTLGTLYTTGNVGLGSSASVVSILTAGSVDTSTLSVSGNTTLNTLTTAGNAGIGQSLTVTSASTLDSLSVTKSISGATLGISGDSNLATVYTSGNVGIGATTSSNKLDVWGDAVVTGNLTLGGNLLPNLDDVSDLGSNTARFRDLYLGPGSLHVGTSTSDEYTLEYDTANNRLGFNANGSGPAEVIINSTGNVGIGTTDATTPLDIKTGNTSGTLLNVSYKSTATLTGALIGIKTDLNDGYVTPTNQDVTGLRVVLPTTTNTNAEGTVTLSGMSLGFGDGVGINQNGAGATVYNGTSLTLPALTQTQGTLTANGVLVTTPSSITTGGTANGFNISATGVGAGNLNGVNIGTITGGSGTETGINIGTGWDAALKVGGTTVINGSGVTQVAGGGTGIASYNIGDILYASAEGVLTNLGIGTSGQILTTTSGIPVWANVNGSSCVNCLTNNPTSTQTLSPTGQATTGLSIRQTSTAEPSQDIFNVTNSAGDVKYFYVDKDGNVSTGGVASTTLTLTPGSDTTALTLVGTNVTTADLAYLNANNTEGTILDIAYGSNQTLTGTLTGTAINFTNLGIGASNQSVTGTAITMPGVTNTNAEGTKTYTGLSVTSSSGVNQNGAGATTLNGVSVTVPAITQTQGTLTANGVLVTTPSSITTGGTANGVNIAATGVGSGTLYGLNISTITPGAGTEYGINIGTGWDYGLYSQTTNPSYFAGNLGIGATTSDNKLDVWGDARITGNLTVDGDFTLGGSNTGAQFLANDGTASAPGYSFTSDTDSGLWRIDTNRIALTTGGGIQSGLTINSNGNVGIGTTNPGAKLQIGNGTGSPEIRIYDGNLVTSKIYGSDASPAGLKINSSSSIFFEPGDSREIVMQAGGVMALNTLESSNSQLRVVTDNLNDGGAAIRAEVTSAPTGATSYGIHVTNTAPGQKNYAGYFSATGGGFNYGIYSAAGTNYFNGNVGIGNTAPGAGLSVSTNAVIGYSNGIYGPATGLAVSGNVGIGITTANSNLAISGNAHIGSLRQGISAPTDGLFVNGNVGIGATTSSNKLDVWGNSRISGTLTVDSTTLLANNFVVTPQGLIGIGITNPQTTLQVGSVPNPALYTSLGNVGIGTTGLSSRLSIGGNVSITDTSDTDGTGADGACSVTDGTVTLDAGSSNTCAGRATADAVNYNIATSLSSGSTTINVGATPTGIATGDEILVINLRGTSTDYANVGKYETHYVTSVSGNFLTLDSPLVNTYDGTTQKIMVQRIPQYTTVTIGDSTGAAASAVLTTSAYNNTNGEGGVIFFRATGAVTINSDGKVDGTSKGYAGGGAGGGGGATYNGTGGGGGGVGSNGSSGQGGGGGGGQNAGNNLTGGTGTTGGAGGGGGQDARSGGGGGGYGGVGTGGNGYNGGSTGSSGSGTSGGNGGNTNTAWGAYGGGGGGGTYGSANLSQIYFGSGGGGGGRGGAGSGGNGGGIIFISANRITVTGSISANGADGSLSDNTSAGGGGAGGSIYIKTVTATLGSSLVTSSGGTGGTADTSPDSDGGNGGTGRIRLDYTSSAGVTSPGVGYTGSISPSLFINRSNSIGDILGLQYAGTDKFRIDSSGNILSAAGSIWQPLVDSTHSLGIGNSASQVFVSFDTQNSRVGIGTTGPGAMLSVSGNGIFGFGSATSIAGPSNGLAVSGNLGIGTTTASSKLTVVGNAMISSTWSGLTVPTSGLFVEGNVGIGATTSSNKLDVWGDSRISGTLTADGITSLANTLTVLPSTGFVGIGTTSPDTALHLLSSSTQSPVFKIENTNADANPPYFIMYKNTASAAANDIVGIFNFTSKDASGNDQTYASMRTTITNAENGSEAALLRFDVANAGSADTVMSLYGGNVGIGTDTTPDNLFSVGATSQFQVNSSGAIAAVTGITTSGGYTQSGTGVNYFSGNVGIGTSTANSKLSVAGGAHIGSLRQGISAPTDGLFVDGNVGIGATTSSNKLDVWGNARITGTLNVDSTTLLANNFVVTPQGLIGIGITNPQTTLQVGSVPNPALYTSLGNVGIGTTGLSSRLSIGGNVSITDTSDTDGTGADGACSVTDGTVTLDAGSSNTCAGRATADAVNYNIATSLSSGSTTINVGATPTGIATGDEILVINLRGTSTDYANVGKYETHYVTSVSGNFLTLDSPLVNTYDGTTQKIMVQRIPQYTTVTIGDNISTAGTAVLTTSAYNNTNGEGGVIFFRATGAVTINSDGKVDGAGKGYAAGPYSGNNGYGGETYNGSGGTGGSVYGGDGASGQGGGGGATDGTGGAGTTGGGGGAAGYYQTGGGGGGYGTVGSGGTGAGSASGTTGGDGGSGTHGAGGGGGTYGSANLSQIYFGSGGGASGNESSGGSGGGIIFISAPSIAVTGTISTNGNNGGATYGGGGGGAGGSVYLKAPTLTVGSSLVTASGGNAGKVTAGAGGSGRIRLDYTSSAGVTSPGAGYTGSISPSLFINRSNSIGDILGLQYAGTDKFRIDSSGNILSAAGSIWQPLVDSTRALGIGNSASQVFVSFDTQNSRVGIGTTGPGAMLSVSGNGIFGFGSATSIAGPSNGLAVSGNLGIGTTTASSKLTVVGNAMISSTWSGLTVPTSGLFVEGNVGIGATTSSNKLDVWGDSKITGTLTVDGNTSFSNTLTTLSSTGLVGIGTTAPVGLLQVASTSVSGLIVTSSGNVGIGNTTPSNLFDVSKLFVVSNTGNVGVGTTSPLSLLSVYGGAMSITDTSDTDGTGNDGACSVTDGTTTLDTGSCVGAGTADAVNYNIATNLAAGSTTINVGATPTGIAAGDEVLIINLRGTSTDYANVGKYETHYVTNVSGQILTLDNPLKNSYDGTTQKIMVQRIPQYTTVTIGDSTGAAGSAVLTTSAYSNDNGEGGVIFFRATGAVTINSDGKVDGAGKGYAGGARGSGANIGGSGGLTYNGTGGTGGNNDNPGADGSSGQGGGGGKGHLGSSAGSGTIGGAGGGGGAYYGAGGGGGYGGVGRGGGGNNAGSDGSGSTGGAGGGNDAGGGGGGGTYGSADLSQMYLGSGGGGASTACCSGTGGSGGNGGGIIFIAASNITISGSISANGNNGGTATNQPGGGGGSGGSVYLKIATQTLGSSLVTASSGSGGAGGGSCAGPTCGTGGNGGTGRIRLDYTSSSGVTSPGAGYTGSISPSLYINRSNSIGDILGLQYAGTDKFRIDSSGNILSAVNSIWQPLVDSTRALGIGNSASSVFVSFDTQNSRVGIGTTGPGAMLSVSGNGVFGFGGATSIAGPSNGLAISGNVGIGTTTANYNLSVIGTANFTGQLTTANGSASAPAYSFTNSTGSGLWYTGSTNKIALTTAGSTTSGITIDANGNIGVGTSMPYSALYVKSTAGSKPITIDTGNTLKTYLNPLDTSSRLFEISVGGYHTNTTTWVSDGNTSDRSTIFRQFGSSAGGSGAGYFAFYGESTAGSGSFTNLFQIGLDGNVGVGTGSMYSKFQIQGSGTSTGLAFLTTDSANTQRFAILDNGNVGIGTTSPIQNLHITGASGNPTLRMAYRPGTTMRSDYYVGSNFAEINAYDDSLSAYKEIRLNGLPITFAISGTEKARFDSSGNLGIGTTTANSLLSISGNAHIGSIRQGISAPTDGLFVDGNVGIGATTSSNKLDVWGNSRISGTLSVDSTTLLANNFVVTPQGLIGIGITNPQTTLQVGSVPNPALYTSLGNVGIGTTGLSSRLSIGGNVSITDTSDTDGTGADGACSVTDGTVTLDAGSSNTCAGRATADSVNYNIATSLSSGSTTINVGATPTGIATGDEILVINLRGTSTDYANVGKYETHYVTSVSGNFLTLDSPLVNTYDGTTQKIMVQRIPQYTTVTIGDSTGAAASAVLTTSAYNNTNGEGGVIFFRATGAVTINSDGKVDGASKGYAAGGWGSGNGQEGYGGMTYNGTGGNGDYNNGGTTGQGGGGGGNLSAGTGTTGGAGGGAAWWGGGGGGGGYGTAGLGGYGASNGSGETGGNGGTGQSGGGGGGGGTYGSTNLSKLMFGSGGGGSFSQKTGGAGGGIIFIAASSVSISGGSISTNGGAGDNGTAGNGGAGGGAGGSIWIKATTQNLGPSLVTASGGNGGTGTDKDGGNGGVGRIRLDYTASSGTVSPGAGYTGSISPSLYINRSNSIGDILGLQYAGTDKFRIDSSGNILSAVNSIWQPMVDSTRALGIGNSASQVFVSFDTANLRVGIGTTGPLATFQVNATGTSSFIVNSSGNVGVGATTPAYKLDIWGTTRSTSLSGEGNRAVYSDADGQLTNSASDIRLKTNIQTISDRIDVLSALDQLRGVYFNWNMDIEEARHFGAREEVGMIAQEVEAVLPGLIGINANGYKSLNYAQMSGFLIEVGKAQQKEISALSLQLSDLQNTLSISDDGTISIPNLKAGTLVLDPSIAYTSEVSVLESHLDSLPSEVNLNTKIASLEERIAELEKSITGLKGTTSTTGTATASAQIAGEATSSASVTSSPSTVIASTSASLSVNSAAISTSSAEIATSSASTTWEESEPTSEVSELELTPPDILLATSSASLIINQKSLIVSEATVSGQLTAYDLDIQNSLKALGKTTLADTTIAGTLTVDGTLTIDNGSEINVMGTLYLQKSAFSTDIDIFDGKVTIDYQGNITTHGKISASEVVTNKLTISSKPVGVGSSNPNVLGQENLAPTIGSDIIPAGQTEIPVFTSAVNNSSKVFLTATSPTGGQTLIVSEIVDHAGFVVSLDHSYTRDIKFNWWIIDTN